MILESFTEAWESTRREFDARRQRLIAEITGAWQDTLSLTKSLTEAFRSTELSGVKPGRIASLKDLFEGQGKILLFDPLATYNKKRPIQRVLSAISDYQSGLEDLVRLLPVTMKVSGAELAELIGPEARAPWRTRWLSWQGSAKTLPLRDIVSSHLHGETLRRARVDGAFQLVLAQTVLHLMGPWQICRRERLAALSGKERDASAFDSEKQWWLETAGKYESRAARVLEAYRAWAGPALQRLARAVFRRSPPFSGRKRNRIVERYHEYFSYWSRQQRAVVSLMGLERELSTLGIEVTQASEKTLESLQAEHDELLRELDSVIEWIDNWQRNPEAGSFPPPQARLLSAQDRVSEWVRLISGRARFHVPTILESIEPERPLPGWRSRWRQLGPQRALLNAVERTAKPAALGGFLEAEAGHKAIVREIERAREVVTFGFETAQAEGVGGMDLAREAVANAHSLLLYQKRTVTDVRPVAEEAATRAQAMAFLETHIALEEGRLGQLAYLTRQSGRRAAQLVFAMALQGIREGYRRASRALRSASRWVLYKTGWAVPRAEYRAPVAQRPYLGQVLELQLGARNLPMLYRRLFRLAPVEDPRFLVGRDAEMLGLAEALSRWESGRGVSVIVVGARGSGKTSLLNCASSTVLSNAQLVSGQFCERVLRTSQLEAELRNLLKLPEGTDIRNALAEEKRVIILEEFERTFLRTINGFEALRAFLSLMDATSGTTLWILSINETSFRYLDVAVGLGRHFSHRINAMSVKPEHLTNAILQRHNLSGLRLQFAPLPAGDPRISQARRFFGLEKDPQELFFEGLYEQSEGIFRSAFELWQDCIEREEGGVVHMRQPLDPDYRPLLAEINQDDFFTLQAVLQHGSLTAEELSQVFGAGTETTRRRLERLLALEVLEAEPVCPGLRVRPQAGRFVRDALHRQNLL